MELNESRFQVESRVGHSALSTLTLSTFVSPHSRILCTVVSMASVSDASDRSPSSLATTTQGLEWLNALSPSACEAALLSCCASTQFAALLAGQRPFASMDALLAAAHSVWWDQVLT